ncbi:MAG: nitrate/nitrite-specific signal transduction histidine kinase [Cellvibrionaceae bacterium]|jgi:nitrate/nitrite-specific signal transduction histidine kinase
MNKGINTHKLFVFSVLLLSMMRVQTVSAAIDSLGVAVDVAGSQRMLSQRIFKNYCLIILDVKPDKYKQSLKDSSDRFERQLAELSNFSQTDAQKRRFDEVSTIWEQVNAITSAPAKRIHVDQVKKATDQLLRASHAAVQSLQTSGSNANLRFVDISGRQRMLSQRMANRYMMKALGFDDSSYRSDLDTASREFKVTLDELLVTNINTKDISTGLKKVKAQHSLFVFSLKKGGDDYFPFTIADASEKILVMMHKITGQYADIVK